MPVAQDAESAIGIMASRFFTQGALLTRIFPAAVGTISPYGITKRPTRPADQRNVWQYAVATSQTRGGFMTCTGTFGSIVWNSSLPVGQSVCVEEGLGIPPILTVAALAGSVKHPVRLLTSLVFAFTAVQD